MSSLVRNLQDRASIAPLASFSDSGEIVDAASLRSSELGVGILKRVSSILERFSRMGSHTFGRIISIVIIMVAKNLILRLWKIE